jgi:hypothetical protein
MQNSLTPLQFAYHLPKHYEGYTKGEYFPGWVTLEERLTRKAAEVGYLNLSDLVEIAKWGRNQFGIAGRVRKENTEEEVITNTKDAIQNLNDPRIALESLLRIKQWGLTYASKTLRAVSPQNYAALDSLLREHISERYLSESNVYELYVQFLALCGQIRDDVSVGGPREDRSWFLADVEMALFQFVRDGGEIV